MSAYQPPRPPRQAEAPTAVTPREPLPPREPPPSAYPPGNAPGYESLPPEDPRWWERGWWAAALAALAGFILGGLVGLLASESSSTKTVTTGAAGTPRTLTVAGPTHTTTVTHVVVHTVTAATPSSGTEGGGGHTYTGNGTGSVGTITVSRQSTLRWRSGGGISIKNSPADEHSLSFNSGASSGESPVEPGTYHQVSVTAPGEWTFTISPG